jgi:hypothetical protein
MPSVIDEESPYTGSFYLAFISAAGFASSSALYNLGDPMFVHDVYTVGPFQVRNPSLSSWRLTLIRTRCQRVLQMALFLRILRLLKVKPIVNLQQLYFSFI